MQISRCLLLSAIVAAPLAGAEAGMIVSENLGDAAYSASGSFGNLLPRYAFDGIVRTDFSEEYGSLQKICNLS